MPEIYDSGKVEEGFFYMIYSAQSTSITQEAAAVVISLRHADGPAGLISAWT